MSAPVVHWVDFGDCWSSVRGAECYWVGLLVFWMDICGKSRGLQDLLMWALVVAKLARYHGAPPTVRIFPAAASYITALPFMASGSSPRRPAGVTDPRPAVLYQFIRLEGPAWNT